MQAITDAEENPFGVEFDTYFMPYDPFGRVWASLSSGLKKFRNLSIILRRGSASGFISSYLFIRCIKPPLPEPSHPEPASLSDFFRPSVFCSRNSTQVGGVVIHLPRSTRCCNSLNSDSSPVSMSSSDIVLHKCMNTCTHLWIQSTMSTQKIRSPEKDLSY